MSQVIVCSGCGQGLRVPTGHDGPYIECPACGEICDVPRQAPAGAFKATPSSRAPVAKAAANDDEDDSPYKIPPDPNEKTPCPKCRGSIKPDAIVCAHCGYHLETGETFERVYKTVDLQWESGLPFRIRFGIFSGTAGMAMVAAVIVGVAQGEWATSAISVVLGMALQAYVLGTYARVNLSRNRRGRVRLFRTWRVCFIPLRTIELNWRAYEAIGTRQSGEPDFWDLAIFLFLLPFGLIPAIVFWMFMIQPGQYDVALCENHGYPAVIIYRGPSQKLAQQIAAKIREYTNLP
jgi:hypothetical protein